MMFIQKYKKSLLTYIEKRMPIPNDIGEQGI